MPENPHPPETGPLPRRRRYRTRMFDHQLSFPTTSEQARQLQAESDAQGRSVASLVREAIDRFLPRLRERRRRRRRSGTAPTPAPDRPAAGEGHIAQQARRLLGDPEERTAREWRYGSLRIDLETGLWKDSETGKGGNFLDLVQRTLQTDQDGAVNWVNRLKEEPPE